MQKRSQDPVPLSPVVRRLMLEILAGYGTGDGTYHRITGPLAFLDNHFPAEKLEPALRWVLRNGLVGEKFVQWFQFELDASNLELHRKLLAAVERADVRPIIIGKDFR